MRSLTSHVQTMCPSIHHLDSRLYIAALSISYVDNEASKSDYVLRYVMSPRTTTSQAHKVLPQSLSPRYPLKSFR
jgi:hypothetical protein